MRTDSEWMEAAARFRAAEYAAQVADDEKTAAREQLLRLSDGKDAAGFGVTVTHQTRKGSIDFRAIADSFLSAADQEPFRKESVTAVIVKVIKEG